jgi:hypothetical protein
MIEFGFPVTLILAKILASFGFVLLMLFKIKLSHEKYICLMRNKLIPFRDVNSCIVPEILTAFVVDSKPNTSKHVDVPRMEKVVNE